MSQPQWKLIDNIGTDDFPCLVYRDETGVYPEEMEFVEDHNDGEGFDGFMVYRLILERCTFTNGVLSDNPHRPNFPAWFADDIEYGKPWGEDLIADLCSDDAIRRAWAYRALIDDHGAIEFDQYPLTLSTAEKEERYRDVASV
jgi:hypothetical protein